MSPGRPEDNEWYVRGFRDLLAARALAAQDLTEFAEVIVSLCVRSAGKLLLGMSGQSYGAGKRAESLETILQELNAAGIATASIGLAVRELDEFGTDGFDPDSLVTPEGAQRTLQQAEVVLRWIESQLE